MRSSPSRGRLGDRPEGGRRPGGQPGTHGDSPVGRLTPREREVLAEMAQGKNNAGIAAALVLTERAVEKHINSMFSKLGLTEEPDVHRRVKAVLLYLGERKSRGLAPPPDRGGSTVGRRRSLRQCRRGSDRPRPDRRRPGALPPGSAGRRGGHARFRGGGRGRERGGRGRAGTSSPRPSSSWTSTCPASTASRRAGASSPATPESSWCSSRPTRPTTSRAGRVVRRRRLRPQGGVRPGHPPGPLAAPRHRRLTGPL